MAHQQVNEIIACDMAIAGFFHDIVKMKGKGRVPLVFAPPQKAWSALARLFKISENERIPLPAFSLHRGDVAQDSTRFVFRDRVKVRYDTETSPDMVKVSTSPQMVLIPYTLELWSYTTRESTNILRQLHLKFLQEIAYIVVDFGDYGRKRLALRLEGLTDTTEEEAGETERIVRHTLSAQLNGVLYRPIERVRTVKTIEAQYRDWEDTQTLEVQEVTDDA